MVSMAGGAGDGDTPVNPSMGGSGAAIHGGTRSPPAPCHPLLDAQWYRPPPDGEMAGSVGRDASVDVLRVDGCSFLLISPARYASNSQLNFCYHSPIYQRVHLPFPDVGTFVRHGGQREGW